MIYIVFDTNIWVYLANGYDSEKGNYYQGVFSEHHFALLQTLREKVERNDYQILVNDLIFKEWERNKHNTEELIHFLEKRKREIIESAQIIKAFLSTEDFLTQERLIEKGQEKIEEKILQNKRHIQDVEDFLINNCVNILISDEVIKKVSTLAMEKRFAPFLSDKNNFPDAIILYSSVEFLNDKLELDKSRGLFVSNNFKDFASKDNKDVFHPDIINDIGELELTYERHLARVVGLTEDMQEDIEYFLELKREIFKDRHFYCQYPFCQSDEGYHYGGYFDTKIRIAESLEEFENPNQLRLFPLQDLYESENDKIKMVYKGKCDFCGTVHVCCPACNSLMIDLDELGEFYCRECDEFYEFKNSIRNKDEIIIKMTVSN